VDFCFCFLFLFCADVGHYSLSSNAEASALLKGNIHTRTNLGFFLSIAFAFCLGFAFCLVYLVSTYSNNHTAAQQAWEREVHQHQLLREGWRNESILHDLEREQWRKEREERERERESHKPFWDVPQLASERCLTYETREYTARLWNIQLSSEWYKACMSQPISIHDRTLLSPDRCENRVSARKLSAVDSDELLLGYGGRSMGLLDRQLRRACLSTILGSILG